MVGILLRADDVLRRRGWASRPASSWASLRELGLLIALFGVVYGATMGSFGGVTGERAWQVAISAVKVPLLLVATFAVSMPSFFVLNSLFGLRRDFAAAHAGRAGHAGGCGRGAGLAGPPSHSPGMPHRASTTRLYSLVRRGQRCRSDSALGLLQAARCPQPSPPLDALDLGDDLRLRGHPNGLDPASLHREPQRPAAVLSHRNRATPTWL